MRKEAIYFVVLIFVVNTGVSSTVYPIITNDSVYAQQLPHSNQVMGVKITSPTDGQRVPVGELKIAGTSTDNPTTDCQVYVDVNDIKPLQITNATGVGGQNDYSNWTYTYTANYHLITEGINELTAKLACDSNPINVTKWYSVNVTGVSTSTDGQENDTQQAIATDDEKQQTEKSRNQKALQLQQKQP